MMAEQSLICTHRCEDQDVLEILLHSLTETLQHPLD